MDFEALQLCLQVYTCMQQVTLRNMKHSLSQLNTRQWYTHPLHCWEGLRNLIAWVEKEGQHQWLGLSYTWVFVKGD